MKRNFVLIFFISLFSIVSCSAQTAADNSSAAAVEQKDEPVKCKDGDIDCFIRAAETCQKASYTYNDSADMGAFVFSKSDYFEIRGGTKAECTFYLKVLDWKSEPNEKYLAEMKKRGKETYKPDPEMQALNDKRMKDMIGTEGVCTFTAEKLGAMFKRWKEGSFSSSDYRGAKCKGTYFVPENGFPEDF